MTHTTLCTTPEETAQLGRWIGQLLFRGAVVALVGPLGAGKTFLTRAIAEGLGIIDPQLVTSPTFVLIQEYPARLPIYHFDVYRLKSPAEFEDLGAVEYLYGEGVCLIEWADKVESQLPRERLRIELEAVGETERRVTLTGIGEVYRQLVGHVVRAQR
jgi:tRNA threonylcarbamoyladenosine biosynthesis protein TsaE